MEDEGGGSWDRRRWRWRWRHACPGTGRGVKDPSKQVDGSRPRRHGSCCLHSSFPAHGRGAKQPIPSIC